MSPSPVISIITVTWNTAQMTAKCIETVNQNLEGKIDYEILVADNGSTDNSAQVLSHLDHVIYFNTGDNLGYSKACNLAAAKAKGQYLYFINSDMEFIDDSLLDILKHYQSSPNIGIIAPKFLFPDLTPQGSVFPPQTYLNAFKEFWLGQPTYSKYTPTGESPVAVWTVSGGAIFISRSHFDAIGGWDESYHFYFEEFSFCQRVRNQHLSIIYFPQSQIIHRHGASGAHLADSQNQWRRLIPGSIHYHGFIGHYLLTFIIWSGQKFHRLLALVFPQK